MDELDSPEKNLPHEKSQNPRSTGPTSPEGKTKSSMNRLTHGCRSERTVLPFEDEEEWEFTLQSWMNSYHLQDPTAATLVFETARAQWIFQRNQQRLDETESGLPPDAIEWTEDHIKRYNNFLRYKTTAERSFYRAFNNLEAHYKRQADKAAQAEQARAQMAKTQMQWLKNKAEAAAKDMRSVQLVEVTANSRGESVTTFVPANDVLIDLASKLEHPPEFVSRFVFFTAGVPPAYNWLNPNHIQANEPAVGVQQFTWSGWLQQIEAEERTGRLEPVVRDSTQDRTGRLESVVRDPTSLAATGHLEPYSAALLPDPD
jgi:hypothetical protein